MFINSRTRPFHASEGDETRRQGSNCPLRGPVSSQEINRQMKGHRANLIRLWGNGGGCAEHCVVARGAGPFERDRLRGSADPPLFAPLGPRRHSPATSRTQCQLKGHNVKLCSGVDLRKGRNTKPHTLPEHCDVAGGVGAVGRDAGAHNLPPLGPRRGCPLRGVPPL